MVPRETPRSIEVPDPTEQQYYYRYGLDYSTWEPKHQPSLPREVAEAMKREHLDDKYRFLFMGVAVVRSSEKDPHPVVIGDPRATHVVTMPMGILQGDGSVVQEYIPWLTAYRFFGRVKRIDYWYWLDDDGARHKGSRADQLIAPPGKPILRQDKFIDFGHLQWELQIKASANDLEESGLYAPGKAPGFEWQTIQTFRSPEGWYLEPDVRDVEPLVKQEWENRNAHLPDVVAKSVAARIKRYREFEAEQQSKAKEEWDAFAAQVIRDHERQAAYSLPSR